MSEQTAIERALDEIDRRFDEDAIRQRNAEYYAGENPMAHHAGDPPRGGMAGASDVFSRFGSIEMRKFKAGECIVIARKYRALGYLPGAKAWLRRAIAWRQQATEMTQEMRQ